MGEVASRDLTGASQQGLEELAALADEIGNRFPAGRPAVLSFLSAEPDPMVDLTAREMARLLALTGRGPVLLIDSHLESRRLTRDSGAAQASGLIDAAIEGRPWRPMIRSQWDRGVDFLPCGARETETLGDSGALRSVMIEIKQSYQYVCVAAGAAALAGQWWSDVSDGCYLLVSLKNTHAAVARSAVAELQASGARLLGCVVTDVEGQGR